MSRVHDSGAHRIAFDVSGGRLASGGLRGRVHIWASGDGTRLNSLAGHSAAITGLAWLDGARLLSADNTGVVQLRDVDSGDVLAANRFASVKRVAVSPDASWALLITGKQLVMIGLPGLAETHRLNLGSTAMAVAIDPARGRIALATRDGRVQLLSLDLEPLRDLAPPSRDAHTLVFSPDGQRLIGGGWFRLLVWDVGTGRLEERNTEHLGLVNSVAISPDGRYLLSLGRETDSKFQLVDLQTHQVLRRFKPHALCGQEAGFSPDGRFAASSSDDGSVHIYDLSQPYTTYIPYLEND